MNEFDLIKNYFATQTEHRADVLYSIGDDAAITTVPPGYQLALTTDTLVAGIHFLPDTLPYDLGYKSLAVNLSDLAAMGAEPAWALLALTLPNPNEDFIQSFCDGFFTLANRYKVELIGGDLTHGPLSITVQAIGFLPSQKMLLRKNAQPADLIYVTGTLGDAGLALRCQQNQIQLAAQDQSYIMSRLNRPDPRVAVGEALRDIANAAIDISDGLVADLGHILEASNVGARVDVNQLPLSPELKNTLSEQEAIELALTGGDDYELCFTIAAAKSAELEKRLSSLPYRYTCIGTITAQPGLVLQYKNGHKYNGPIRGYQHF